MPTRDPLGELWAWLSLAIILIALVQIVPASNKPIVYVLGLVALYLLLTHAPRLPRLVDTFLGRLGGRS